jgi:RND family efflux transporter MFP subunit
VINKSARGVINTFIIFLIGVAIIWSIWFFSPEPSRRPPSIPQAPIVQILETDFITYQSALETQGTIEPTRQINLTAEVSGRIVDVNQAFVDGGVFSEGQTLITLDDRDYRFALINAESAVAAAERELALQKGQARQAKREWRDLGSKEANALSLRQPQVRAAEAALAAAKAELDRAKLNLKRTQVAVPFAGRVLQKQADLGQFVTTGSSLGIVYDHAAVEVRLPLNQKQLNLLGFVPGMTIERQPEITLSTTIGGQEYRWSAKLSRMDASIDTTTRFYHIVAEVAEPFNLTLHPYPLLVGLFVKAEIKGRQFKTVIELPKKAIFDNQVYVVSEDDKLELHKVNPVDQKGEIIWVQSSTIQSGNKVVISDPRVLREGLLVRTEASSVSAIQDKVRN